MYCGVVLWGAISCVLSLVIGNVIELTDDNFETEISKHSIALVKFYAPWCGHCKKLAPEYDKAAKDLKNSENPVPLLKMDCTTATKTCKTMDISGYPTLKIFRDGKLSQDYEGPRDAKMIVKTMQKHVTPNVKELKTVEDLEKFISSDELSVVGFFETESKLQDSFMKVTDTEKDRFRFAYTSSPDLIKKHSYTDDIIVYQPKSLHSKFENKTFLYTGNYDTDKIKNFINFETTGLAGYRTTESIFQFEKLPLCVVYYKIDFINRPSESKYYRNRVLMVASESQLNKAKISFAVSNKDDFINELEEFNLADQKDSIKPLVTIRSQEGKYVMDKDFSYQNLAEFVSDVLNKKITPYIKSEPIPEEQGDVKVAVGKNFKELIMDSDMDVLIEFYAPWCGHCKTLAPKYDELGAKLSKENVIIAKIDATANDFPPIFKVAGFPTIYWWSKGSKKGPVKYEGGREVQDFIKFIAKNSAVELKGYTRDGKKKKSNNEL